LTQNRLAALPERVKERIYLRCKSVCLNHNQEELQACKRVVAKAFEEEAAGYLTPEEITHAAQRVFVAICNAAGQELTGYQLQFIFYTHLKMFKTFFDGIHSN